MGCPLSIDAAANIVFGMTMAVIGAVTAVQIARFVRLYTRPSIPYLQCGQAASTKMHVSSTEPDVEDQLSSAHHSAQSQGNIPSSGDTLSGLSTEDKGQSKDSTLVSEYLRGIGTSFDKAEAHDENDLFEDIKNATADTKS